MSTAAAWVILLPLAGGMLSFVLGSRSQRGIAGLVAAGMLYFSFVLAAQVWEQGSMRYLLGGWEAPLGINLHADGLSAFMLMMTAVVGALISLYSFAYYAPTGDPTAHERKLFWPLWLFLWAALNAMFLTADLFNAYVVFEMIGLAAIALITLVDKPAALTAAMRYLMVAFLGSLSYLMGVALLYALHGTLDLFQIGQMLDAQPAALAAFALMSVGLLLKTALFPMHFWLPRAHASAPAPVSALLSALVVKASLFMFIRLWFVVFPDVVTMSAGQMIGVLGAAAVLWGSVQALRQQHLKLLIAHSTVAQLGYMFLLFPLMTGAADVDPGVALGWQREAWTGVIYQVLAHALAKAAMFMAAGAVIYAYGTDKLAEIGGLYDRQPLTVFALALAGMSLMGLPPSGGFVAKWLIMKAAIGSGQWWWIPVIVLGGLLTAAYVSLMLRYAFKTPEVEPRTRPVNRSLEIVAMVLAVMAILIGFRLEEPFGLLIIGAPLPGGADL